MREHFHNAILDRILSREENRVNFIDKSPWYDEPVACNLF
jgi:hypothetical protein